MCIRHVLCRQMYTIFFLCYQLNTDIRIYIITVFDTAVFDDLRFRFLHLATNRHFT